VIKHVVNCEAKIKISQGVISSRDLTDDGRIDKYM
jgi:hypothetical protein